MANLTMTNWRIEDKLPYINLGSAGENNASTVTITVDEIIDHASYYLDIGDESGSGLPNTQELTPSSNEGTNGEMVYTLSMQPMVTWLGREGVKLLQVRCVYTEDDKQVVKESNVFHAKVDRNSGFVYKYDIAVFEEYLAKIKEGGGCSGEYVTEDELIEALRPYATETEVDDAIITALIPYPTTTEVDSAISTALTPYPTKTEVNNTINTALTPYAKTSEVNTAISDALTPYSTTSQMNTAINNAVADKQDIIQVDTLPTASVEELGKIYQYIGETIHESHKDYVHGYFYECKEISSTPITYTWQNLDVIEMPYPIYQGASSDSIKINNNANVASGASSVAEGHNTTASGQYSHAEGSGTTASSQATHAEGHNTTAEAYYAHSEGRDTQAKQTASHAQNMGTIAQGNSQTAIGKYNVAQGSGVIQDTDYALIIGNGESNSNRSNALAVQWDGTVVMQDNSTIKSAKTVYEVMGKMGAKNLLSYPYSDGNSKTISDVTFTVNQDGVLTSSGVSTEYCYYDFKTLEDKFFLPKGDYILSDNRIGTNIDIYFGVWYRTINPESSTNIANVRNALADQPNFTITQEMVDEFNNNNAYLLIRVASNADSHGVDWNNITIYPMLRFVDYQDPTWQPFAKTNYELTQDINDLSYIKNVSIYQGEASGAVEANNQNNHAQGIESFAEGHNTQARGSYSHTEGNGTIANSSCAHAEGTSTTASGIYSHAEGQSTTASGWCAHAEGNSCTAQGDYSHAEGSGCGARGNFSHAQNHFTNANGLAQTVIGEYNIVQGTVTSKSNTDYALIIGNGTADDARSNALAVQWDGNVVFQDGSKQNSASISIADLKTLVANCSDFADFQTQIASL